jgi:hypothetical protein
MNEQTIITVVRFICGTAILCFSVATHTNGLLQGISLFLIGVPVEYAVKTKETAKAAE